MVRLYGGMYEKWEYTHCTLYTYMWSMSDVLRLLGNKQPNIILGTRNQSWGCSTSVPMIWGESELWQKTDWKCCQSLIRIHFAHATGYGRS